MKRLRSNQVLRKFKNKISSLLPATVSPRIIFREKFGSFFIIKDKVKKEHRSDLVYKYECDISIGCDPWE